VRWPENGKAARWAAFPLLRLGLAKIYRQMSVSPANSKKVAAPPSSPPSMKAEVSMSNRSTVIWQAISLTSASWQRLRSSSTLATPFDAIFFFIMAVIIACMPGSAVSSTGNHLSIAIGMGMPGLPSGVTSRLRFFSSSLRP